MTTKDTSLIVINANPISRRDLMEAVEFEITNLIQTGDLNHVMHVLDGLENIEGVTGHMKARLLWATREWFIANHPGENFSDHVESTTSLKRVTVDRYITVQNYIQDYTIPKDIQERPMRDLVPIAKTLSQGYEITKDGWRKIRLAANDGELREVLRQIKGKAERKSAKVIVLERDGSLYLRLKDTPKKFLGYLALEDAEKDEEIANALRKIIDNAGIIQE